MKTKTIWTLVVIALFGAMVTTALAAETAWNDTFTDSSNISASENITVAGGDVKLANTTSASPCICGSGTDHNGADWSPGTDEYGCHYNIGTCTINGTTVKAYSGGDYGWLEIHADTINVTGSGLAGTGMGYPGGAPSTTYSGGNPGTGDGGTNNAADGAGQGAHMSGGGGGGYGASGGAGGSMGSTGCGYGGAGGDAYGTSNTYQMKIGAGGAAGATTYDVGEYGGAGGAGGAGVLLNASNITINGSIRVNGSVGSVGESGYKGAGGGGAGAGGCIVINAGTLSGSGSLYADGGDGGDAGDGDSHAYGGGGGGAGGRIKLWYNTSTFSGSNSMSGGSGGAGGTAPMGGGRDGCSGSTGTYLYTTPRQSSGGQEYKPSGYLNSTEITPTSFESWDTFYANHSIPSGTNTTYRILNASDNSTLCEVNATEAAAGYNIPSSADSNTSIRLYAFLNTTNTSETPVLHDWNVSWTPKDLNPPASITNLTNTTGNFRINWTWDNPADPDFNHTMVYIDDNPAPNTSESFYNDSYSAHATKTISTHTVDTNGNVNSTWVNQTTTIPNNLPVLDPIGNKVVNETETLAIDADATDSDSDTLTYSCNRTDLFADFGSATGSGNWTPDYGDAGIYYVDFGTADGYGGIDNETIRITVNETEVTGNLLYFSPDTSTVPGYCCSVDVDVMALVNESNPIIATDVNITFDPGCINITNWVNNSNVWNGSTCPLGSVPQGYVHITTTVGANPAVNGTVKIGTLTIHCNNTTCCGTPLNFTSESMFIKEGSGFIYPERDNGSFLCGWYWKDYNGEAEGGYMPDFDQNQDFNATQPGIEENYCAPTAMANSLWWFDQKYPDRDVVSPGATPQQLIQELAWLMDTNGQRTGSPHNGTYVADEQAGIEDYLIQHGLTDLLYEHTELKPEFDWIEEEIERCQDVKLDLGFYQVINVTELQPEGWEIEWKRIGGHAVTAAGVNSNCSQIAVSDPDADNAEFGLPGVVRGPNHNHGGVPFWDTAYNHTQHNDGVSASHDIYNVAPSISPGGTWELTDPYWRNTTVAYRYAYNNGGQWMNITNYNGSIPPVIGDIRTEIEAAVVVSPKNCTPGIEVNKTVWDPVTEKWVEEITSQANISGCVRYRIQVQNNGTCCDLTNLVVNDTLPGFLTYNNSAIPFEPTDLGGNKYQWTFPTLNKSETKTIEFNATVNNTGNGTNEAFATAWCAEFGVECSDGDGAYITAAACGDVNGDGFANIQDGMMVAAGNTGVSEWAADADCDGLANIQDGMKIASGNTNCCPDCT